jgi:5'(3')-deoxyribonucleotidase
MTRELLLVDVDGVVADLMLGFDRWLDEKHGERIPKYLITHFNIPTSPALKDLHKRLNLDKALASYMGEPEVYERYVDPIPGAADALIELQKIVDVVFVTATLKDAPESYVSKFHWCRKHFGPIEMIAAPSRLKHIVQGTWIVDDRGDTCERFRGTDTVPLLFGQPWNESPPEIIRHDWPAVVQRVKEDLG